MKSKYLIVSPHPDDACFSLGGSILRFRSHHIMIWDVFTNKKFNVLNINDLNAQKLILKEEYEAIRCMHVNCVLGDLKDAQLRGYKRLSEIVGVPVDVGCLIKKEQNVYREIKEKFKEILNEWRPNVIGIPMGVGYHIDHILSREAVLEIQKRHDFKIFFYEDLPYAHNEKWLKDALEHLQRRMKIKEFKIQVDTYFKEKEALLRIYKSQIKDRDIRLIKQYMMSFDEPCAYERVWIPDKELEG